MGGEGLLVETAYGVPGLAQVATTVANSISRRGAELHVRYEFSVGSCRFTHNAHVSSFAELGAEWAKAFEWLQQKAAALTILGEGQLVQANADGAPWRGCIGFVDKVGEGLHYYKVDFGDGCSEWLTRDKLHAISADDIEQGRLPVEYVEVGAVKAALAARRK